VLTVAGATGNTVISGTLTAGASTLASASVTGALSAGATTITGATGITGATTITGDVKVKASDATDKVTIASSTGNTVIAGTLNAGASTLASASVTGALSSGAATLASASVTGALSAGATTITGATGITGAVTVTGATSITGDVTVKASGGASTFLVAAATGNTAIAGAHGDASKELYVNGDVYATGLVSSASDGRYKRDVQNITGALETTRALRAVSFAFQTEAYPEKNFPTERQVGFIAQELEAALPDVVTTDSDGYKGIAYERLGVYALAGVKDVDELVQTQRRAILALEERVATLARAVEALSNGRSADVTRVA
jgi:hypothetical protein